MVTDVYNYMEQCASRRKHESSSKHQRLLQLFPPSGALEFIAIEIFAHMNKATQGNQFVIVIIDRYSKLTKAAPVPKVRAALVATVELKQ